jgi:hypothetical protein
MFVAEMRLTKELGLSCGGVKSCTSHIPYGRVQRSQADAVQRLLPAHVPGKRRAVGSTTRVKVEAQTNSDVHVLRRLTVMVGFATHL